MSDILNEFATGFLQSATVMSNSSIKLRALIKEKRNILSADECDRLELKTDFWSYYSSVKKIAYHTLCLGYENKVFKDKHILTSFHKNSQRNIDFTNLPEMGILSSYPFHFKPIADFILTSSPIVILKSPMLIQQGPFIQMKKWSIFMWQKIC